MKTKIVYSTLTGNIEKFISKLNHNNITKIEKGIRVYEPYVLIVGTINFGEVPIEVKNFLRNNYKNIIGVTGSGNRNWGKNFAVAADIISEKFSVPLLSKFELSGNTHDVDNFIKKVEELENEQQN